MDKVITKIGYDELARVDEIQMRLYGGWYENSSPTIMAQSLAVEIAKDFPGKFSVVSVNGAKDLLVTAELAYSLEALPAHHLHRTYRPQSYPYSLKCNEPTAVGCAVPACPMVHVHRLVNDSKCSEPGCGIKAGTLLYVGSQKLVDGMLTSDLLYKTVMGEYPIYIVSSDDDVLPGVMTTLSLGGVIVQIHTKSRTTPMEYVKVLDTSKYRELQLI